MVGAGFNVETGPDVHEIMNDDVPKRLLNTHSVAFCYMKPSI